MQPGTTPSARQEAAREIVVFHSVLGLRPGVLQWAERLRAEGHLVHTPDLYDGEVFDDYDAGFAKLEAIGGIAAIMERTRASVAHLPQDVVYAGFSNGGGSAELLALTRPEARGAILMHAALPVHAFGAQVWPTNVPVQVHYAVHDPFREQEEVDALAGAVRASGAHYEAWDYPGSGHLFADPHLAEFDALNAELMFRRVLDFLRRT
jgi:dienelactone hydrolase